MIIIIILQIKNFCDNVKIIIPSHFRPVHAEGARKGGSYSGQNGHLSTTSTQRSPRWSGHTVL